MVQYCTFMMVMTLAVVSGLLLRPVYFPIFDWLRDRDWLSSEGNARDFMVVTAIGLISAVPVVVVLKLVGF